MPTCLRALTLTVLASVGITGCTGGGDQQIVVGPVGRSTVTEVVEAPATVVPKATATLTAPSDGRVETLLVADGATVKAGQVLLRLDSPRARAQLAEARRADARAAVPAPPRVSMADYSRTRRQGDTAAAEAFASARDAARRVPDPALRERALADVARAEAAYATARADAQAALARVESGIGGLTEAFTTLGQAQRIQTRAAVNSAARTMDALVVRAPIAGTVTLGNGSSGGAVPAGGSLSGLPGGLPPEAAGAAQQLLGGGAGGGAAPPTTTGAPVSEGAPVSAGAAVATVTDDSTVTLAASVDETDILLIRPGLGADVDVDAVPGASYAARVTSVHPSPTTSSRGGVSYQVRLTLGGGTAADGTPAPRPRAGMSAVAGMRVRTAHDAVSVPVSAVVREGNRDTVWVVERGLARRRPVTLGAQGEETVQVSAGLRVGELVVRRGADRVRDGQRLP
jgi:HlyD family secretion protein